MNLKATTVKKIEKQIQMATLPIKEVFKRGNTKIGRDTLCFSISTAWECESAKKGMCPVRDICYAVRDESFRHNTVPRYRKQQNMYWDTVSVDVFVKAIKAELKRNYAIPLRFFRFNISGDLRNQNDYDKIVEITKKVPELQFYLYTHRNDLNYNIRPDNLVLNGSGFMLDNEFRTVSDTSGHPEALICNGDCYNCDLCKTKHGETILVKKH